MRTIYIDIHDLDSAEEARQQLKRPGRRRRYTAAVDTPIASARSTEDAVGEPGARGARPRRGPQRDTGARAERIRRRGCLSRRTGGEATRAANLLSTTGQLSFPGQPLFPGRPLFSGLPSAYRARRSRRRGGRRRGASADNHLANGPRRGQRQRRQAQRQARLAQPRRQACRRARRPARPASATARAARPRQWPRPRRRCSRRARPHRRRRARPGGSARARAPVRGGEQFGDRVVDVVGEHVHVGQRLAVGVHAEARLLVDGRHADRDRVVVGQRHHRIGRLQGAAEHVHRHAGPGDVRHHEVERAGARDQPRQALLHRRPGRARHAFSTRSAPSGSPSRLRRLMAACTR